jgi:hypothetical protein
MIKFNKRGENMCMCLTAEKLLASTPQELLEIAAREIEYAEYQSNKLPFLAASTAISNLAMLKIEIARK